MKDMLFEVPRNKTRLELVKEKHGIETTDQGIGSDRWLAHMKEPWQYGRGATEIEAVLAVCAQNKIEVVL